MKSILVALMLLAGGAAWADDAPSPSLAAMAQVKAAVALQQATTALQEATAQVQRSGVPASSTAAPVVVQPAPVTIQPNTEVSLPAQIRDGLVSLAAILIPGLIGVGLTWLRTHWKVMNDVAMNTAVTNSASQFGGLLLQSIQSRGMALTSINVHSPEVASFTNSVLSNYPQYSAALGLTPDKIGAVIIKAAATLAGPTAAATLPAPAAEPAPVPAAEPIPVAAVNQPIPAAVPPGWPAPAAPV